MTNRYIRCRENYLKSQRNRIIRYFSLKIFGLLLIMFFSAMPALWIICIVLIIAEISSFFSDSKFLKIRHDLEVLDRDRVLQFVTYGAK
jgi:hypothetical protein